MPQGIEPPFQLLLIGLTQAFHAIDARRAGEPAYHGPVADQLVAGQFGIHQQQVATVLQPIEHLRAIGDLFCQIIGGDILARGVAQGDLQMQGDAGVGDLDLQLMAEYPHQLAAAQGIAELIARRGMEEHQAGAVLKGMQLAAAGEAGLLQLFAVALQQSEQARAG